MGIRFYCPNGHRLNVKEFQAGQKGICPFCGAKMQIPLASTRPSSCDEKAQSQGGTAEIPATDPEAITPPADSPTAAATTETSATAAAAGASASTTFAALPEPSAAIPADDARDPLSEAAGVVWYVRPSSGGQFGPAAPEVMRAWLVEGRIAPDALVWREGWRDWQQAGSVFPQLAPASPAISIPGLEDIDAEPTVAPVKKGRPAKLPPPARRKPAIIVGALALLIVVLLAIFLWVLMKP